MSGNFSIQSFDLNIGVGADIISTLNYYGMGDPFSLLVMLLPLKNIEWLHGFLEIFYLYMAGVSFSILCMYQGKKRQSILVGALIYTYSGYAVIYATKYIFFISPMFQLPLLIIGVDLLIKGRKSLLFSFVVFYSGLCGFYFLYMMTIMGGAYAIIRIITGRYAGSFRKWIQLIGRILLHYLLGIGMAAMILLPVILGFLSSSRTEKRLSGSYFFYDKYYYLQCLMQFVAPTNLWIGLSLAAITLFALILLLFSDRKKYLDLKCLTVIALAIYFTPLGGSAMNGFSYPTPRWAFGLALLIAYITVEMLPALLHMKTYQKRLCLGTVIIYLMLYLVATDRNIYYLAGGVFLVITFVTLQMIDRIYKKERRCIGLLYADITICICLVICNVSINALFKFVAGHWIYGYEKSGVETERVEHAFEKDAAGYVGDNAGRFDSTEFFANYACVWEVPTLYFYWSITNQYVMDYWKNTENTKFKSLAVYGSDERTITDALFSVKYCIEEEDALKHLPFGYEKVGETEIGRLIFENNYALPWGYTYSRYISYEDIEQMNGLEKEEIMLQSIALDKIPEGISRDLPEVSSVNLPYESVEEKGVIWKEEELQVIENGGEIKVKFQMPAYSEGYLRLQGFVDDDYDRSFNVKIESNDREKSATIDSTSYRWYSGKRDYLFNLGYKEEWQEEDCWCTITFPETGIFQLEDIQVLALPMESYLEKIESLREEPLESIEFESDRVRGTINLSQDKILCMSIPYSKGWSATVDGEPAEILRGNIMFMALPLKAGEHVVEFTYCSPGQKLGIALSMVSAVIMVFGFGSYRMDFLRRSH